MEKNKENIKDYSKNKILCKLVKPRAIYEIIIVEKLDDPWFLYVISYKPKTGEIMDISMIVSTDVNDRINHLKHVGYELKK